MNLEIRFTKVSRGDHCLKRAESELTDLNNYIYRRREGILEPQKRQKTH